MDTDRGGGRVRGAAADFPALRDPLRAVRGADIGRDADARSVRVARVLDVQRSGRPQRVQLPAAAGQDLVRDNQPHEPAHAAHARRQRRGTDQLLAVRRQLAVPGVGDDDPVADVQLDGGLRAGEVRVRRPRSGHDVHARVARGAARGDAGAELRGDLPPRVDGHVQGAAHPQRRERVRHLPVPPGDHRRARRLDRGRPHRRLRRVPHLPDPDHAAGATGDGSVLPDHVPRGVERVPRAQRVPPEPVEGDAARRAEPVRRDVQAAVRRVPGGHAAGDHPAGDPVLRAPARVHQRADERGGEAMSAAVPPFHGNISFNAQHAPFGAFFSFTCGHFGTRGGFGLQIGKPGNQDLYIGVKDGDRFSEAPLKVLPFYEGAADANEAARYDVERDAGPAEQNVKPKVVAYAKDQIRRHYGWATDRWVTDDLEFTIYTPF